MAQDLPQGCNQGGSGGLCSSQDLTERGSTSGLTHVAVSRSQLLHIGKGLGWGEKRERERVLGVGGRRWEREKASKTEVTVFET